MKKHTPGPWFDAGSDTYFPDQTNIKANSGTESFYVAAVIGGLSEDEHKANVSLIAAAPDLLEALQDVVNSVARCTSGDVCQMSDFSSARAAIAKATGES